MGKFSVACHTFSGANRRFPDRIKIKDDNIGKDTLAAWACIRLDRLKTGYRFIHLLDERGMESSGVLLVKVVKLFS
jgi:hypothetical protein